MSGDSSIEHHRPVLRDEVVAALCTVPDGAYVDATFGRGGHARALLAALAPDARLLVIDRDPRAVAAARALAAVDARVRVAHGRFSAIERLVAESGLREPLERNALEHSGIAGVLIDLGVSSPQLDDPTRGFSFREDGPLDMRMDPDSGESAAEWLAKVDEAELARVLETYGEERFARRIARAIVARRRTHPITRTLELAEIVDQSQPRPDAHKHAATRTFQAIRIHVNDELTELPLALEGAFAVLSIGGRLAVIAFHSLEDRIVKRTFALWTRGPETPRRMPIKGVRATRARPIGKAVRASGAEVRANPRARSATLRVVEKVA